MATGYQVPTPAPFKPAWDNPEKNYQMFESWLRSMRHYLLLSRPRNQAGQPVNWPDEEKMSLAMIIGGPELRTLFMTVAGQVIEGNGAVTFDVAATAASEALQGRMNETSQVYTLNKMEQGSQPFASWYPKVLEAAQRVDWQNYNAETAAKNVMIFNCNSEKLRMKAIAEDLNYNNFVRTAMAMESSEVKAKDMVAEGVRSLKDKEVKKLSEKVKKLMSRGGGKQKDKCKTCGRQGHPPGQTCFALKLTCHSCNQMGHLQTVCKEKKEKVKYVSSPEETEEEVNRVVRKKKKRKQKKQNKKQLSASDSDSDDQISRIQEHGGLRVSGVTCPRAVHDTGFREAAAADTTTGVACPRAVHDTGFQEGEIKGRPHSRQAQPEIVRNINPRSKEGEPEAMVDVNGRSITFTVDSGVKRNLVNWTDWKKISGTATPVHTSRRFVPYGVKKELPVRAKAQVTLKAARGARVETEVFIVESNEVETLLGRDDALRLGIIQLCPEGQKKAKEVWEQVAWLKLSKKVELEEGERFSGGRTQQEVDRDIHNLLQQFPELFQGLGEVKKQTVDIQLKPGATPKVQPRRTIPIHYMDKLKKKVEELKKEGVIEGPLQGPLEPGSYVSNPVITAKKWSDNEIRLNLDLSDANADIVMSEHPIPTPEELRHEFRDADTFSSIDANQMFQQWLIMANKRKIFTFRTPWGLYRYIRLPSGVNCASAECNNNFRAIVEGLEGVVQIQDDVVVFGKGKTHDQRLEKLLARLAEWGITLRREKCRWGQPEVLWFGKVYSRHGVSIDPAKTEVIRNLPTPQNAKETRSFLQMAQFNAEFLHPRQDGKGKEQNYSELTRPLRDAAKAGQEFKWTKDCQHSFDRIKELMASDKVLEHYHPERPTKVYVDFSTEGVSATLAQGREIEKEDAKQLKRVGARVDKVNKSWVEWRPVTHVSRSLEPAERNYASVEGESLAVCYGVWRLRRYLWGAKFTVAGDHQPLLAHYNTNKTSPHRVIRHRMKLQGFVFDLVWEAGEKNPTDYPSRHPLDIEEQAEKNREEHCCDDDDETIIRRIILDDLPEAVTLQMVQEETGKDPTLSKVREAILARRSCPAGPQFSTYLKIFDELVVEQEVVVRGQNIVLPQGLVQDCVELAHRGHLGPGATIALLRETVWFPRMKTTVDLFVESCIPCQAAEKKTRQPPMEIRDMPPGPWHTVHADYKGSVGGQYHIHVAIDGYSRFAEVDIVDSTTGAELMPKLDKIWATHGVPAMLISDNGPPYQSHEFAKYCKKMGIKHRPITETHPQSNAVAERFMKRLVRLIHAAMAERKDPRREVFKFVLNYNATKHSSTGKTPAELLMNRTMRTLLPGLSRAPSSKMDKEAREKDLEKKMYNKKCHDKRHRAKDKQVEMGDQVLVKQKKTSIKPPWDPNPYTVQGVSKRRLELNREDGKHRRRDVGDVKLVKRRPEHLRRTKAVKQNKNSLPIDVDLDVANICNRWAVQAEQEQPEQMDDPEPEQMDEQPEQNLLQMDIQDLRNLVNGLRSRSPSPAGSAPPPDSPQSSPSTPRSHRTAVRTRVGRQVRPPARYGRTPSPEVGRGQSSLDSIQLSDLDTNNRVASNQATPCSSPKTTAGVACSRAVQDTGSSTKLRPPAGMLQFDPVFWGEDEETDMLSPPPLPRVQLSPRERRRRKSRAKKKN